MHSPLSARAIRRLQVGATAVAAVGAIAAACYFVYSASFDQPTHDPRNPASSTGQQHRQRTPNGADSALRSAATGKRKGPKRVLTISVKNIILWNPSPDPMNPNYAFNEALLPYLTKLYASQLYDIYLITVVSSDKEEEQITELLSSSTSGLLSSGLDPRKILFCDTEEGKSHIVRHIEPHIHVDSVDSALLKLIGHVPKLIRILRPTSSRSSSPKLGPVTFASETIPDRPQSPVEKRRFAESNGGEASLARSPSFCALRKTSPKWTASGGTAKEEENDPLKSVAKTVNSLVDSYLL
ncbi:hypothetical protein BJ742DRAFT_857150 [Cladochytrium replicatum]|nr:hypothetical protein BJ742DRAFT_857150 [Cladochytrium replicatum]